MSTIHFDIPAEIERSLRERRGDLDRDAKEVYLMEQYRRGLLKRRGLGQDLDDEAFGTTTSASEPSSTSPPSAT